MSFIVISIVEDNKSYAQTLKTKIENWSKDNSIPIQIKLFENAESFIFKWPDDISVDVAFLDIDLNKNITGYQLAEIIRNKGSNMIIVFLTALESYVYKGYNVDALRFLLKPVEDSELFSCLDKINDIYTVPKKSKTLPALDEEGETIYISINVIVYMKINSHDISIYTNKGKFRFKFRKSISELYKTLPNNFAICTRSYLVNLLYINCIKKTNVELSNGDSINLGRSQRKNLNEAFIDFHKG